jgi:hypothetical protein
MWQGQVGVNIDWIQNIISKTCNLLFKSSINDHGWILIG